MMMMNKLDSRTVTCIVRLSFSSSMSDSFFRITFVSSSENRSCSLRSFSRSRLSVRSRISCATSTSWLPCRTGAVVYSTSRCTVEDGTVKYFIPSPNHHHYHRPRPHPVPTNTFPIATILSPSASPPVYLYSVIIFVLHPVPFGSAYYCFSI